MIVSNLRQVRFAKSEREGRDLTYRVISEETGLSTGTIVRLMSREPIETVNGNTLSALCAFFGCTVGDLLLYVPDSASPVEEGTGNSETEIGEG